MTTLNDIMIAPLVRGLYLNATGTPVVVKSVVEPSVAGKKVSRNVIAMSLDALTEEDALNESKVAIELTRQFTAAAGAPGTTSGTAPGATSALPAFVDVSCGEDRLRFEVRSFTGASASSRTHGNSALSRASVVAGKIALVTGGAQGFGAEIVRGLAASGAFVYIADLNLAGAAKLAEELCASDAAVRAFSIGVNVTEEASVAAMFETIAATTGGLDLIVSNAGVPQGIFRSRSGRKEFSLRHGRQLHWLFLHGQTRRPPAAPPMAHGSALDDGHCPDQLEIGSPRL